jgi:hypothetical protein
MKGFNTVLIGLAFTCAVSAAFGEGNASPNTEATNTSAATAIMSSVIGDNSSSSSSAGSASGGGLSTPQQRNSAVLEAGGFPAGARISITGIY